ncbi:PDR/VanB family oxidoreductase [Trujillonella endophytica]|uniref:Ferredoxin-NADP reductase n=1 Tax=Trujillonella endophytica TaxID=673521 RepID=A0A1H8VYT7_9ACTN|nr:PDR/VanB family oxidoreductase [Trujillella endophytica]SEP20546.1 Ferredoxin-NADP reductase [Trujillella endophytica]
MTAVLPAPAATGAGEQARLVLEVSAVADAAPGIRTLTLRRPGGGLLPGHPPGSHLVLDCGGRRNAYSLTGDGMPAAEYRISVLLCPDGAGGSAAVHRWRAGDRVTATGPRSAFAPVSTARHAVLVAGGIGITPLLSHARAAVRWGRSFELLYGHRPGAGAHLAELHALCGDRLGVHEDTAELLARIGSVLADRPLGTHVHVCGPAPLIAFVEDTAGALGWPADRVHAERFSAADLDPGEPFVARLARSGLRVPVPAGTSLLAALEAAGVAVPSMCRQGVCGECRLPVTAGRPLHRDLYLAEPERAAGDAVMACVSRCADDELELDL